MRILLVAPMFPPQRGVAPLRTHSFAAKWAAAGHAVTVLTTKKRADQVGLTVPATGFQVVEIPSRGPWPLEVLRRLSRYRAPAGGPVAADTGASLKDRLLMPLRYLKGRTGVFSSVRQPDLTDRWIEPALGWAQAHGPWDVVVTSGGPPAAHLVALGIRGRGRCRLWAADFRDLWSDNHIYTGLFPWTLLERHRERRVLANVDRLVTVSPGLATRLAAKAGKPVEVIYNGYDPADFAGLPPEPIFPADGRVRLVYTGTVYDRGQDLRALCAAVAAEPAATLVVASDRADLWHAAARRAGLGERLDFRGSVPRADALRMQRDASVLVLLDWYDPRHGVLTGKVFEYLLSPAPIWVVGGARDSPAARLVAEAGRGVALGRDVARIRTAIRDLAAGRGPRLVPNREFIAGLARDVQARRFLRLLEGDAAKPVPGGGEVVAEGLAEPLAESRYNRKCL
ncbi:MAG TPA: glycosyltransferase [Gemmataceae bacterium]|nr:glycosyltransferase [Gemmataceae bacterium]